MVAGVFLSPERCQWSVESTVGAVAGVLLRRVLNSLNAKHVVAGRVHLLVVIKHLSEYNVQRRRATLVTARVPVAGLAVALTAGDLCATRPHALGGQCASHPRQHQLSVYPRRVVQDQVVGADHVLEVIVLLPRVEVLEHLGVSESRRRLARLDGPRGDAGGVRLRDHARYVVGDETLSAVRPDHRAVVVQRHLLDRIASTAIFIKSNLHHICLQQGS